MIKKSFPVQKPYYYDTKDGIDHFTKLLVEENPKKLSPKELQDIDKLGKDMKRAVLDHHIKTVKPFDNFDSSTFPSDPKVRGKLLEIEKLEKDLTPPKPRSRTGNPSGRDYWKEYVASGGKKLPEVSPEDRNQLSASDTWKGIYEGMTPFEKGQWNAEQRKKKLQHQKEFEEEKKQKRIANHTKRQWGIPDKKSVNYLSNNYSFEENFKKQSKNINDYKPTAKKPFKVVPKIKPGPPVEIDYDLGPRTAFIGLWPTIKDSSIYKLLDDPKVMGVELGHEGIMEAIRLLQNSGMLKKGGRVK